MNAARPSTWSRSRLSYCTNVHAGEEPSQLARMISGPLATVRRQRELAQMSGALWLSQPTAQALSSSDSLKTFAHQLEASAITLFTLNGFPAQGFHSPRVKQRVYQPDWSQLERLDYTLALAHILAALMPADEPHGTISSVPLGFAPNWNATRHTLAMNALCQCVSELAQLQQQSGRHIRLCLEMEPGCVLESTVELIAFFAELKQHAASLGTPTEFIDNHLGICFDVCHQAVMFEDSYTALESIHTAGIHVGKIQFSSALQLEQPANPAARDALAGFIEEKYLHQSRCLDANNQLLKVMDLDEAFTAFPDNRPWRVHFHVPIQAETLIHEGLGTTQPEIGRTLDFLRDYRDVHPHLEVETYTWTALPPSIRPSDENSMVKGLTTELQWLEQQMQQRGLLQEETP